MVRVTGAVLALVLALVPLGALADGYPQRATIGAGPGSADWLALRTLDGTWAIQVGDGCPWISSGMGMNVMLTAPVNDDNAMLVVPDTAEVGAGESCSIVGRIWQEATPCVQHDGVCDVAYDH